MRLLFFSHYFPPEGNAPATRTYENCRRWVAAGHQVTVITCAPNQPAGKVYPGYRNRLVQRETVDGIEVIRVWTYLAANKGTVKRILNYTSYMVAAVLAALTRPRPDLVIATSPQFFCGWAGVIVAHLRARPLVLEIRDLWPDSIVAVGAMTQPRVLAVLERLERWMYAAAERIVTVGEGYREQLLRKGVAGSRIDVVMNGIDRDRFSPRPPDADLARRLGLQGTFVCSYVGTIGMACGLEVVLRAARLLDESGRDDIRFLLVGDGASREQLEREAQAGGLSRIVFTGRQSKDTIPAYLSISSVCLVHLRNTPLFSTVMPSKIFEAAGMARPILLGVGGHARRIVETAGAGIVMQPENEHELVEALIRLADDPALCESLGRAGHDHVVRHFDRDQLAGDYLKILRQVATEREGTNR